jgi:hypothetical protein
MIFKETQRFRQKWIAVIFIIAFLFLGYNGYFYFDNYREIPFQVFFGFFIIIILLLLFYVIRLETIIDVKGIKFRFYPFHLEYRSISFSEISEIEIIEYNPLDYGGWGIKHELGTKVYSISGNKGIKITTNENKQILIGSNKTASSELIRLLADFKKQQPA